MKRTPLKRTEFKRKPPRSRPQRTTRQALEAEADAVFRSVVKAPGVCTAVGQGDCWGPLECCHIFTRGYRAIRWDPRNAVCLCHGHHRFFTERPSAWSLWVKRLIGAAVYEELQASRLLSAPTVWELPRLIKVLQDMQTSPANAGRGR